MPPRSWERRGKGEKSQALPQQPPTGPATLALSVGLASVPYAVATVRLCLACLRLFPVWIALLWCVCAMRASMSPLSPLCRTTLFSAYMWCLCTVLLFARSVPRITTFSPFVRYLSYMLHVRFFLVALWCPKGNYWCPKANLLSPKSCNASGYTVGLCDLRLFIPSSHINKCKAKKTVYLCQSFIRLFFIFTGDIAVRKSPKVFCIC